MPKVIPANRTRLSAALTKPNPDSVADLRVIERQVESLVSKVGPAVVGIEFNSGGQGSGVVISADGLVLTAGHVVAQGGRVARFRFPDGRVVFGTTLGNSSGDTGLARITDRGTWPYAPLGELSQTKPGDWVVAMGHPGGYDPQRPRVVRLGRIISFDTDTLRTDCTISPGDSGGPLFDMNGRVIGIHSFISAGMTENFHVPINQFTTRWADLAQVRAMAYLGAQVTDRPEGCRVLNVDRRSPAEDAGIKVGDLLRRVEDRDLRNSAMLQRWLSESKAGDTLVLEVDRKGRTLRLSAKLTEGKK